MISMSFVSAARFRRLPVAKLSRTRTVSPRSTSARTRAEPMKPAPPVTRTFTPLSRMHGPRAWLKRSLAALRMRTLEICLVPVPAGIQLAARNTRDDEPEGRSATVVQFAGELVEQLPLHSESGYDDDR